MLPTSLRSMFCGFKFNSFISLYCNNKTRDTYDFTSCHKNTAWLPGNSQQDPLTWKTAPLDLKDDGS